MESLSPKSIKIPKTKIKTSKPPLTNYFSHLFSFVKISNQDIYSAAKKSSLDNLIKTSGAYVDTIFDPHFENKSINTGKKSALHLAIDQNDILAVKNLLEYGANPNLEVIFLFAGNETHPLHRAIKCPFQDQVKKSVHLEIVRLLIAAGANVNAQNHEGNTALHLACIEGDNDTIQLLLANGAKIDSTNNHTFYTGSAVNFTKTISFAIDVNSNYRAGDHYSNDFRTLNTPLHLAAIKGHIGTVQLLINKGANIHLKNRNGHTPLYHAAYNGHPTIMKILLENDAQLDSIKENIKELFDHAVYNGYFEITRFLLKLGVHIHLLNKSSFSEALEKGFFDIIELLINAGIDFNQRIRYNNTPIQIACRSGRLDVVELFIQSGANFKIKSDDGNLCVLASLENTNRDIYDTLVKLGVDNKIEQSYLQVKLYHFIDGIIRTNKPIEINNYAKKIKFLLNEFDIDLNTPIKGTTFLHHAVRSGFEPICKTLISAGARFDIEDEHHQTALQIQSTHSFFDSFNRTSAKAAHFKLELSKAFEWREKLYLKMTPLHRAAEKGETGIINMMLAQDSSALNHQNYIGETPLHMATKNGHKMAVKLLIEKGADIELTNNNKETPFDIAVRNKNKLLIQILNLKSLEFICLTSNKFIENEKKSNTIDGIVSYEKIDDYENLFGEILSYLTFEQ